MFVFLTQGREICGGVVFLWKMVSVAVEGAFVFTGIVFTLRTAVQNFENGVVSSDLYPDALCPVMSYCWNLEMDEGLWTESLLTSCRY